MQEDFAGGFQLALLWQGVVLEAFNMGDLPNNY
jgi:hypothetical protein